MHPPSSLRGLKILEKYLLGGGSEIFIFVWGGGVILLGRVVEEVAPFSYLNHSFILSLNVKVCTRFIVFLQISLCF